MTTDNHYKGIKHVYQLRSDDGRVHLPCQHKNCAFDAAKVEFDTAINHYIKEHGYEILHVGSETEDDKNITVALLGLRE